MIPDCYDPIYQAEQREAAHDAWVRTRPVCVDCGEHIGSEMCLPVSESGVQGYICEDCLQHRMVWTNELEAV